jgi:hypothetical protein
VTFLDLYDTQLDIELGTGDVNLFTVALRKAAINAAQDDFARKTGCTVRYGEIAIVDGTAEYSLNTGIVALDYMRLAEGKAPSIKIVHADYTRYIQGKDDFPRRTPETLDRLETGWRAADAGTPSCWYLKEDGGSDLIGMHPAPDVTSGQTWTWIVPYVANPADMTAGSDVPFTFATVPTKRLIAYHQGLVHFAAAQLEPLRKNYSGVQRQLQLYSGYVAQFLQDRKKGEPDEIIMARNYFGESARVRG